MKMMHFFPILGFFEISILCSCFIWSLCYFYGWQHYAKDEFTNVVSTLSLDVAVSAFNLFELMNSVQ